MNEARLYMHSPVREHRTNLFSPGEHNRNEPEILASILDELILELNGTNRKIIITEMIKKLIRF